MKRSAAHVVFLLLLFSNVVLGQGTGTIGGTVTDPSGAVVPSATITVTEVGTGYSRSATTSEEGYYIIPSLRPGSHILTVEAPGFRNHSQSGIVLLADQRLTQNVKLELGSATETVTVESAPLQVDTTTGTLKQVVDQARMVGLPLNGRNAADLTVLLAGTVRAAAVDADQGVTKTFPGAVTISSNGSRQNHVSFALDGGNFTDQYSNVNMPFPFPDALQEFSFQTSNYGAEHGHSAGGVVNVVTRSGTNEMHGSAFGFLRNAVFNARNFFAPSRDKLKRSQFGGTLGGPVIKDRTFFFFGYQGTRIRNIQEGLSAFLPTPANLRGDFSALLSATHPENRCSGSSRSVTPRQVSRFLTTRFRPAVLIPPRWGW
jgi:Carboxypeptidase regulatory-like domain